jgi:hypothetical protein
MLNFKNPFPVPRSPFPVPLNSYRRNLSILAFSLLLLAVSLAFASCEGPAGPKGSDGQQGPTGPQGDMLPYIPAESGLRGTTWIEDDTLPYNIVISSDGYTITGTFINSSIGGVSYVGSYGKRPDGTHVISAGMHVFIINDNTLTVTGYSAPFTKQP